MQKIILSFLLAAIALPGFAAETILPVNADKDLLNIYQKYKNDHEGANASYIPELAKVNPNLFGIVIITVNGEVKSIGDTNIPFAIESVEKPFAYALALQEDGETILTKKIGLNATGQSFNSVLALDEEPHHLENPLVNAGAIQITSFLQGTSSDAKWQQYLNFVKKLSDGKPYLGEPVYKSETATNQHNQGITELLNSYGMLNGNAIDALDRYTKACSIMVTARELAIMGGTLANEGMNPFTKQKIIQPLYVRDVLAEMVVNGLYENSGAWFWKTGIPAKSGVGGGIVAVVPHKMAIVVFSPPLDGAGNSVRAQKVIEELSERWHLHLLQ